MFPTSNLYPSVLTDLIALRNSQYMCQLNAVNALLSRNVHHTSVDVHMLFSPSATVNQVVSLRTIPPIQFSQCLVPSITNTSLLISPEKPMQNSGIYISNAKKSHVSPIQGTPVFEISESFSLISKDTLKKGKRTRRHVDKILRPFKCPLEDCGKVYGSEGSLYHHMKVKHPSFHIASISDIYKVSKLLKNSKNSDAEVEKFQPEGSSLSADADTPIFSKTSKCESKMIQTDDLDDQMPDDLLEPQNNACSTQVEDKGLDESEDSRFSD